MGTPRNDPLVAHQLSQLSQLCTLGREQRDRPQNLKFIENRRKNMAIQYLKIKPKHMHAIQSDNNKQQIIIQSNEEP